MRRLRKQFGIAYAAYASKVLLHAPSILTNSKYNVIAVISNCYHMHRLG
jgi:hypothetical protein